MTSINNTIRLCLLAMGVLVLHSCNTDPSCEELGTCPEQGVLERIDLVVSGDLSFEEHAEVAQGDNSIDLIDYVYYGSPSQYIDFIVRFTNGHRLIIKVYNNYNISPWEHAGVDYAIYPTQDLDDKFKYVLVDYIIGSESPTYTSNIGVNVPAGVTLDVFRITSNNGVEIRCRIRDMVLYKYSNPNKSIEIDGTFVGAVTFLP